jgi:hypothetical protein
MTPDIEITGEPGSRGRAQTAFDTANGFVECAIRCLTSVPDPSGSGTSLSPTTPAIVSIAFANELYSKALVFEQTGKMPKHTA